MAKIHDDKFITMKDHGIFFGAKIILSLRIFFIIFFLLIMICSFSYGYLLFLVFQKFFNNLIENILISKGIF